MNWYYTHTPIDETQLSYVENKLNVEFPNDYRKIVKLYHGGEPARTDFEYKDNSGVTRFGCLSELLSFDLEKRYNILSTYNLIVNQLPSQVIPIGGTGSGDYICFDYRQVKIASHPVVVFWSHEQVKEESIVYLSKTFSEFLTSLIEADDD